MARGKQLQPAGNCEYCNKELPAYRSVRQKYCDPTCRQRARYAADGHTGVECLVCGKFYRRVGSHVTQRHGYESSLEYRHEFGLKQQETRSEDYAEDMRHKLQQVSINNLQNGAHKRYTKGGKHGEMVSRYWAVRKAKQSYKKLNTKLGN